MLCCVLRFCRLSVTYVVVSALLAFLCRLAMQNDHCIINLDVLKNGGNAADAAVAMATNLSLTQPLTTGLGGDAFCLYYDSKTKTVSGLNGRYTFMLVMFWYNF